MSIPREYFYFNNVKLKIMPHLRVYFQVWKITGTPVGRKTLEHWPSNSGSVSTIQYVHASRSQSKQYEHKKPWILTQSAISTILSENPYNLELTKKDCEKILHSKLGEKNFEVQDFTLSYFIEMMGFHGNYAGLKINCIVDGKKTEYRFFVKTTANNPVIKEKYWDVLKQPYKEYVFLTRIHKELQRFVQKAITAECHLGRLEEVMVLDDCCSMGYSGMRQGYVDVYHARTGIAALANLHAASIICKEKTGTYIPEKYKEIDYESLLSEHEDKPKEFLLHSVDAGVRQMGAAFFTEVIPQETQNALFSKIRKRIVEMHQDHMMNFHKVLCQGDPVAKGNMLFKYADDGTAVDCILVDFGVARFAPPAMDLMQFLHLNSSDDFRKSNASHLKEAYYDNLSSICSQNGVDVFRVLSRDQFDESCDYYEEWGTCVRVYYEYVVRLPDEQLFQVVTSIDKFLNLMVLGNAELGLEAFPKDAAYKKSVTEAMESAMRFYGYIK